MLIKSASYELRGRVQSPLRLGIWSNHITIDDRRSVWEDIRAPGSSVILLNILHSTQIIHSPVFNVTPQQFLMITFYWIWRRIETLFRMAGFWKERNFYSIHQNRGFSSIWALPQLNPSTTYFARVKTESTRSDLHTDLPKPPSYANRNTPERFYTRAIWRLGSDTPRLDFKLARGICNEPSHYLTKWKRARGRHLLPLPSMELGQCLATRNLDTLLLPQEYCATPWFFTMKRNHMEAVFTSSKHHVQDPL